jgi:hypothetical protein
VSKHGDTEAVVGAGPGIRVVEMDGPKAVSEVLTIWPDALKANAIKAERSESLRSIGDAIESRKIRGFTSI